MIFLHDFIMLYKYTSNIEATSLITYEMMKELSNMLSAKLSKKF